MEFFSAYKQFIIYKLVPDQNKLKKLPIDWRTKQIANAHNPDIWLSLEEARNTCTMYGPDYGIGFVFTPNDPFWFLDIDNCVVDGQWSVLAIGLMQRFAGAYMEVSASCRGLHIIGSGTVPEHACKNAEHKLEFYTEGRFVAMTGYQASGDPRLDFTSQVRELINAYFSNPVDVTPDTHWTTEPCEKWNGPTDDNDLVRRALLSRSAGKIFGSKASFRDIWEINAEALARNYPDPTRTCGYDESSVDAALAQHLSFWTGKNCERIRGLMLQSKLAREKWAREDYLPRTILGACGRQQEVCTDSTPQIITTEQSLLEPELREGSTFLTIEEQRKYFSGCVYIEDEHGILVPGGRLLTPEKFKAVYGGYTMPKDGTNEKTTDDAWDAYMNNKAYKPHKSQSTCFKPDQAPGVILNNDGQTVVNLWWPITTKRTVGDASPALIQLRKLFPDERDFMIILCYIAAIVQYKGVKFQWCPLIQGVEGNGKTFITRCVAWAIGSRYTHFPKAAEITSKFNDWLYCKLFIGVEDIYVPDAKIEVYEAMKPMITSERQEVEPKGGQKITRDICANFILNTNHKEGLRKLKKDRRFAPFYTPQQELEDLARDGMDEDYFYKLYSWANRGQGYAVFSNYIHEFKILDEFNPAIGCLRAPITTSTESAIEHGKGRVEQEILAAIDEERIGFKGGYVSSKYLDMLFKELRVEARIPINKRKELMLSLGYEWHPGLNLGRVNNIVMPDGIKSILYIRIGHPQREIRGGGEIARAYTEAQNKK